MKRVLVFLLFTAIASVSFGQESDKSVLAVKTTETITIDGVMDEEVWNNLEPVSGFYQIFPSDTSKAQYDTEVFITYDDNNVYFLAKCYSPQDATYQTQSLRRDFGGESFDVFNIILDTFQDNTNGFSFGVNPFGVQREGLIANGGQGRNSVRYSWDNKWNSEAKIYDGYWIAEIAIPFKTLRFKDNSKQWNINFYRSDSYVNERSNWTRIPLNYRQFGLAILGKLNWEEPLKKPKTNIAVIPYVSGSAQKDYTLEEGSKTEYNYGVGGDVKIGVTPALNLDLTFNPDFSQVEVDRQQTNLSRFELFFPERRQFFLENEDLFGAFGTNRTRPFFSRRIGITRDTLTDTNVQEDIIYGARLSGKITEDWRIGVLNMQTAKIEGVQPSLNYGVFVLQKKVFARSNISAIFVNKQNFSYEQETDTLNQAFNYNRVAGLDYNLASKDNKWNGKFFYHQSFDPEKNPNEFVHGGDISYNVREFEVSWSHLWVGDNYNAEVGFVPRKGYRRISPRAEYKFYPKSNVINRIGPELETDIIWNSEGRKIDHEFSLSVNSRLQNTSFVVMSVAQQYVYLQNSFDPSGSGGLELPEGSDYTFHTFRFRYFPDRRKVLYFSGRGSAGQYFNGHRFNIGGDINIRYQPLGITAISIDYNKILLPEPYNSSDLLLIGPRLDFTISRSVFITGLFQYNNQSDNFSSNIRLQWRFKPVSDLFIVYTDNYYSSSWGAKNRSLVMKLTYWLNL